MFHLQYALLSIRGIGVRMPMPCIEDRARGFHRSISPSPCMLSVIDLFRASQSFVCQIGIVYSVVTVVPL